MPVISFTVADCRLYRVTTDAPAADLIADKRPGLTRISHGLKVRLERLIQEGQLERGDEIDGHYVFAWDDIELVEVDDAC